MPENIPSIPDAPDPQPCPSATSPTRDPADTSQAGLSRRRLIQLAGLGAIVGGLGSAGGALGSGGIRTGQVMAGGPAGAGAGGGDPQRVARICHFTDSHIRPEHNAVAGVEAAFRHLAAQPDRPDVVLMGGDMIMFSMDREEALVARLWDLWRRVTADHCPFPVRYCIGNHDVWGWHRAASRTTGREPRWGKKWWCEVVGCDRTYQSFTLGPAGAGGWKVLVLDSIQPYENSYEGRLDDEQYAWLEGELATAGAGTNVCVVSHIPIWSVGMLACDARPISAEDAAQLGRLGGPASALGGSRAGIVYGRGAAHMDAHRLTALFARHPGVRLALSGHIHIVEQIHYQGVTYACSGAVSGAWWRGPAANKARIRERARPGDVPAEDRPDRAVEGYALIDLYRDGTSRFQYVPFGWVPQEEP
jgi:Icc protein